MPTSLSITFSPISWEEISKTPEFSSSRRISSTKRSTSDVDKPHLLTARLIERKSLSLSNGTRSPLFFDYS